MSGIADQFRQSGYTLLRQVVSPQSAQLMTTYALMQQQWAGYYQPEDMFRAAMGRYADAMSETQIGRASCRERV